MLLERETYTFIIEVTSLAAYVESEEGSLSLEEGHLSGVEPYDRVRRSDVHA